MEREELRFLIAGGGTGGHIYPAIAVAEELKRADRRCRILFVGTREGLEKKIVPSAGFHLDFIRVGGLKGKSIGMTLRNVMLLPIAMLGTMRILLTFRPHVTLGVGGYASGPVVLFSALLRIPTMIHEQNVIPGATNRLLGRFVKNIAVSFSETAGAFKKQVTVTGNPVRGGFTRIAAREKKEGFHVLFFGGSRGAAALNRATVRALPLLAASGEPVHLTIQTGEQDYEMVAKAFTKSGIPGTVTPFITDMAKNMEAADLLVCRAGATTLAEIMAAGRAAILIPFPQAVHNHQEINARALERKGGARVVLEKDLTGERLADEIFDLLRSPGKLRKMEEASRSDTGGEAAGMISEILMTLASGKRRTA